MPPSTESSTLPRDFRFHYQDGERPKTPEHLMGELRQPSPPRQSRMKLKKRNVLAMSGPTEHFLASVAAADIPLPTIEIPDDTQMIDRSLTPLPLAGYLAPRERYSPPKTPMPQIDTGVTRGSLRRRDWYGEDTSDDQSRPSSALSDPSDWSDDSYFGSRRSRPSDDGSCTSPDSDFAGPSSAYSSFSRGKGKAISTSFDTDTSDSDVLNSQVRSKTRKDAYWSKNMSDHLWTIYELYLQDPTVTPFRLGASKVPPEGVVIRVAREAKRSWKGPKTTRQKRRMPTSTIDSSMDVIGLAGSPDTATTKSGSLTPTGEAVPKAYPKWPHSGAATRGHLRELCKKDATGARRHSFMQSRSPTPFTQDQYKARLRTPNSAPQTFSTQDIALSLATSSAESMQPDGPLAKLADEQVKWGVRSFGLGITTEAKARRLSSPFSARTYGPSSSKGFGFSSLRPYAPRTQSDTVRESKLRSPVSFEKPRSLNGTMKRRAQYALEEELSPSGSVVRPTILDQMLFRNPNETEIRPAPQRRVRSRGFTLGDESNATSRSLFVFPLPIENTIVSLPASNPRYMSPSTNIPEYDARRRLGSPFEEKANGFSNNTFPRRLFSPSAMDMTETCDGFPTIRRASGPYNTMHEFHAPLKAFARKNTNMEPDSDPTVRGLGLTLEDKLTGLESRLQEIREKRN